jgi:hypothetical protein
VDALTIGKPSVIAGKWPTEAVGADLGEHRISVNQDPPPALLQFGYPIDITQVEVDVALAAQLR